MTSEVLIVGAGPTGLVLALWLTKQGVAVRIIDKNAEPGTTSRALAVQARTLELYNQLDLTEALISRGHKVPGVNLWARGERATRLPFETIGAGLTPYAFLEIFPQDQHERLLLDRLGQLGVAVERRTELTAFSGHEEGVIARLRRADGTEETCEARYIAGCDGARSLVRKTIGAGFPGGTYAQFFYVADVQGQGPAFDGELHIDLDEADFLAVFPLAGTGRARLVGTLREEHAGDAETLTFADVSDRAIRQLKVDVHQVNWFSTYRVHHRVAETFRVGRAFLLGDASHIHSPAGGQGMNTGIGDAINLAWKLAAVLRGRAPDRLLDSYEAERITFARKLVATTDRAFSLATAQGRIADIVRTRLAPLVLSQVAKLEAGREFMFRTVSQIMLNYRDGPLSHGVAGDVHGGDRLPWAPVAGSDNFHSLSALTWQVHVYGEARAELRQWCSEHRVPLHVFTWQPEHKAAGLEQDALYLLRPDTYVALADRMGAPTSLEQYFAEQRITPSAILA
jgi:2-polyprenyl-6-methoxyphenol hydroxylase-like FAD-dependent oxidoreductase